MVQPVNRQRLADLVENATDYIPNTWIVNGQSIRVSITDISENKDLEDAGMNFIADCTVTVLNSRIAGMGITYQTEGTINGTRLRVHNLIPSNDKLTTQFILKANRGATT